MKKFLSLVLALVMTMSLVTVSAGAVDFTDDSDIDYKEAVDVISALGIVDGYSDDSFRPDGSLTRGAAAKIICNLILGPTTASALSATTAPFKDVPTTNTFAGYITYCSQQGIIGGYGDGTFRPSGTLTGNAFMKMLLGALGYDSSIEHYTDSNWQVNVVKQAIGIGLDDGNDEFVGSKAVTREEAALYSFNMLQAVMVEYDAKTTVNVNGATVTVAGNKAYPVDWQTGVNNDGHIGEEDGFVQFAEQYFDRLFLDEGVTDDFGRPSNKWTWKGIEVGTYAKTAAASYTADTTLGTIYSDLGMSDKDDAAEVYVDGELANEAAKVSRGNDKKVSKVVFDDVTNETCNVGNGTLIEAFLNESSNDVTIVCINTYVAEVNKVVAAAGDKDAYITLSDLQSENVAKRSELRVNDEFTTSDFATDDVVLYTYSNKEDKIESVELAESVTGELAKRELTKNLYLGENKYSYSNEYSIDGGEGSLSIGSEYEVYLDNAGYAIYVVETEYNIADYAYLRALQSGNRVFQSDKAALWTYDGKGQSVDLNKDYSKQEAFDSYAALLGTTNEVLVGTAPSVAAEGSKIVLAREASDGDYRLKALDTISYNDAANNFKMTNGVAYISMPGNDSDGNAYVYADEKTQVVVGTYNGADGDQTATYGAGTATITWHAYSGAKNMPTIEHLGAYEVGSGNGGLQLSYYSRTPGVATIMFIVVDEDEYEVTAGNNDVIFFSPESASKWTEDASNSYYSYQAVVNGEIVDSVLVDDAITVYEYPSFTTVVPGDTRLYWGGNTMPDGTPDLAFTEPVYNDGVIDRVTDISDGTGIDGAGIALGVNKLTNGNLLLGWNGTSGVATFVVANDVKVFFMDDSGNITEGTINNVRKSDEDIVTFVLDNGQISYLFVQQYFDDADDGTVVTPFTGAELTGGGKLTYTVATNVAVSTNYDFTLYMIAGGVQTPVYSGSMTMAAGTNKVSANVNLLPDTYYVVYVGTDTDADGFVDSTERALNGIAYTLGR